MSKGLEALHHPRIELAKIDISAKGKHDIAYMFFNKTKQYSAIKQDLEDYEEMKHSFNIITCENGDLLKYKRALDIIKELFDFDFALRFPNNQPMLRITNKLTKEYWEIRLEQEEYDLLKEVLL